jgi:hypothetical protein
MASFAERRSGFDPSRPLDSMKPLCTGVWLMRGRILPKVIRSSHDARPESNGAAATFGISGSALDSIITQLSEKKNNIQQKPFVQLTETRGFLRFCHTNFISIPVFNEI